MATDSSILVWEIPWTEEPVESPKSWTLGNRNNKKNKNNNKKKNKKKEIHASTAGSIKLG